MECLFDAEEWRELTLAQKARRCRLMSEEAQKIAKGERAEIAASYLRMAEDWLDLAKEIERLN